MDFELTEEQVELQRVARDVLDRECPPALVRAVVENRDDGEGLWKTFVGLDWPGLAVAEGDGGSGLGPVELVIILEELGRAADPTPFLATTSQFVPLVQECADDERRAQLLRVVCAGGSGAVAWTPNAVTAAPDGDGWRLTGQARDVLDGDRVDEVAVVATTGVGDGVFFVPSASVTATRTTSFDGSLHVAQVVLEGVHVPSERAATDGDVERRIERAREQAEVGVAAATVGASQRVLELTLDHVRHRKQFGVPIGSFQAVKHMAVDMYVAIERAQALCHFAALTIAEDDERRSVAASMAKAAAGDAQRIVAGTGVQLFGGLGFTWENDLQLFVRRAKAGEHLLGSSASHRNRVARAILAGAQS